jgi:prepilin-type processing-associated H-X9-DG protein
VLSGKKSNKKANIVFVDLHEKSLRDNPEREREREREREIVVA